MYNFIVIIPKARYLLCFFIVFIFLSLTNCVNNNKKYNQSQDESIVESEFIFEEAPFASCHASTIAETERGLVAAWFGGSWESNPDVAIWLSRYENNKWSEPEIVAEGTGLNGGQTACWNPVLFQPRFGPLILFYKVGDDEPEWWGEYKTSSDGGRTWSKKILLPDGFLGPIKNIPVQLPDGTILCPSSTEYYNSRDRDTSEVWQVHFELTKDMGKTWEKIGPINEPDEVNIIQPSIIKYPDGKMQVLCRTQEAGFIYQAWSVDGGKSWGGILPTSLPNPDSGTDATILQDGRAILVYNHSKDTEEGRSVLNVAVSENGEKWYAALILEKQDGEYSYPTILQTSDGLVHIVYTWNREKIKHVVLDPDKFILEEIHDGKWPG